MAKRILVVEDEALVALDLRRSLLDAGYEVPEPASSLEEAVARASEARPDLVLMDIRIKGTLDGIETAKVLRKRFGVPVVYLTAHADAETLRRAQKTRPKGYLVKPVKTEELFEVVESALAAADREVTGQWRAY